MKRLLKTVMSEGRDGLVSIRSAQRHTGVRDGLMSVAENRQKVEPGMGCSDWHTAMHGLRLQRFQWIYCPGHATVRGNEWADRLAVTADITSGLQFGRAEVLKGLRNLMNMDRPQHHSTDRLKERGVEKGNGRHSTFPGRKLCSTRQTMALFRERQWVDC